MSHGYLFEFYRRADPARGTPSLPRPEAKEPSCDIQTLAEDLRRSQVMRVARGDTSLHIVLEALVEKGYPMTLADVVEFTLAKPAWQRYYRGGAKTVFKTLQVLRDLGYVKRPKHGHYFATPRGKTLIQCLVMPSAQQTCEGGETI